MVLYRVRFVELPFEECPCDRRRMLRTRSFEDSLVRCLVPCKKKRSLQIKSDAAVRKDDSNFIIPVEVEGYKPEEIAVKVTDDRKVTIQAKHEEELEGGSFSSRQFLREIAIPADIDPGTVRAEMDQNGFLNIRGNKKETTSETEEKTVQLRSSHGCLVPVRGFKPDEIAVKVKDGKVLVHARHEEKKPGTFVYREVRREFPIPPEVHPDSIVAEINSDGLLRVMQRKEEKAEEVPERVISVVQSQTKEDDGVESGEKMATTDDQQTAPKAE